MDWIEKRPKSLNANIMERGGGYFVRVRLVLPNGLGFRRELTAPTKTAARKLRDDIFAAYNEMSLSILGGAGTAFKPRASNESAMTLRQLAETCRDSWWPAKGRSPEVSEQYFQKIRDYVYPVVGEGAPIDSISAADWDRILERSKGVVTNRKSLMSTQTIRKVKASLSSALSRAVAHGRLASNPIKGIVFEPNPLTEADRLGIDAESLSDEETPARRPISDYEAVAILKGIGSGPGYALAVLQLCFGLRIAEALAVRPDDFDGSGELHVRWQVRRRKNPKWTVGSDNPKTVLQRVPVLKSKAARREIITMEDAKVLMSTLPPTPAGKTIVRTEAGGLVDPRNAQRAFRNAVRALANDGKMAVPLPTTHSLRSWRISHWANVVGMPPSHLMRLAGHGNIETTMKYYVRSDGASLSAWLAARPGDSPRSPLGS